MAAILAMPAVYSAARADTDISADNKTAQTTATDGNITIEQTGQVEIKASAPAITINSSNSLTNLGSISNVDTTTATGVLIDTSAGNLVNSTGVVQCRRPQPVGGNGTRQGGAGRVRRQYFFRSDPVHRNHPDLHRRHHHLDQRR